MTSIALGDYPVHLGHTEEVKYRMPLRTTDYVDVIVRAQELGIRAPVGIALLPGNFASATDAAELRYHEAAPSVRTAWRRVGLIDGGPNRMPRADAVRASDRSDLSIPFVVFFGAGLRTSPSRLVTLAIGTIASVLASRPGNVGPREIRLDAVIERPSGGYACLEFRGDAYELFTLAQVVRETWAEYPGIGRDSSDAP